MQRTWILARAKENPIAIEASPYDLQTLLFAYYKFRCPSVHGQVKMRPSEPKVRRFKALNLTPVSFVQEIADLASWAMWTLGGGFPVLADYAKQILGSPSPFIAVKPWMEKADCGTAVYFYLRWNDSLTKVDEMIETDFADTVRLDTGTVIFWWDDFEGHGWTHNKILQWHTDQMAEGIAKYGGKGSADYLTAARNIMNFALNAPSYVAIGTDDGSMDMTPIP